MVTPGPARIRHRLLLAMTVVVTLDVLAGAGHAEGAPWTITRFFNGDQKVNVPTAYKTTSLLAILIGMIVLAALARRQGDRFAPGWRLLSWVTGFAFVDESTFLHQSLSRVLHNHLHLHGVLTFAWTIVYVPAAIAVGSVLLRYVRHLPAGLRWRLLVGGGSYGVGAIAFEPVKSAISDRAGDDSLSFQLVAAMSDCVEMIGLTVLLIVVLTEISRRASRIVIDLRA